MKDLNPKKSKTPIRYISFCALACVLILTAGVLGMAKLAGSKTHPTEAKKEEVALMVEVVRVEPDNVPTVITGYGEVQAHKEVVIAPEVSGKIIGVHPRLDIGAIIPRGEVLFQVDNCNYAASVKEAQANVAKWENTIERFEKQVIMDRQRLKILERNMALSKLEFERVRALYQKNNVGTRTNMEKAEKAYNLAKDQVTLMNQTQILLPIQIREAQSSLMSSQARLAVANADLKRCAVAAGFNARVKSVSIENGQYVAIGQKVLTLADDSLLEIQVPLSSQDARQWLQFKDCHNRSSTAWFKNIEPVKCRIRWTEESEKQTWTGWLHRVVQFNRQTRTLTVAVRVYATEFTDNAKEGLPLVEGMFCSVDIPGKILQNVYRLPNWTVSYKNTVYKAHNNRLKTVPVSVVRIEGDTTIVSDGLQPGDLVISTRLVDPLENTLLEITHSDSYEDLS